uniref:Uncharacterized protein n=1 Tax=Cacopsylla melanoneura TaxID=428564 RepID=A0A8D9A2Y3_9HEMI
MGFGFLTILLLSAVCMFIAQELKPTREYKPKDNIIVVYKFPRTEDENVLDKVKEIGAKLNISNPLDDILKAYRSLVPKAEKPIVIYFMSKQAKERWLDIYEKRQNETSFKKGWHLVDGLQNGTDILEEETKTWGKEWKYYKVWTNENGTVLYKKTESGDTFKVNDIEHLHDLIMNKSQAEIVYAKGERPISDFIGRGRHFYRRRHGFGQRRVGTPKRKRRW